MQEASRGTGGTGGTTSEALSSWEYAGNQDEVMF